MIRRPKKLSIPEYKGAVRTGKGVKHSMLREGFASRDGVTTRRRLADEPGTPADGVGVQEQFYYDLLTKDAGSVTLGTTDWRPYDGWVIVRISRTGANSLANDLDMAALANDQHVMWPMNGTLSPGASHAVSDADYTIIAAFYSGDTEFIVKISHTTGRIYIEWDDGGDPDDATQFHVYACIVGYGPVDTSQTFTEIGDRGV